MAAVAPKTRWPGRYRYRIVSLHYNHFWISCVLTAVIRTPRPSGRFRFRVRSLWFHGSLVRDVRKLVFRPVSIFGDSICDRLLLCVSNEAFTRCDAPRPLRLVAWPRVASSGPIYRLTLTLSSPDRTSRPGSVPAHSFARSLDSSGPFARSTRSACLTRPARAVTCCQAPANVRA